MSGQALKLLEARTLADTRAHTRAHTRAVHTHTHRDTHPDVLRLISGQAAAQTK